MDDPNMPNCLSLCTPNGSIPVLSWEEAYQNICTAIKKYEEAYYSYDIAWVVYIKVLMDKIHLLDNRIKELENNRLVVKEQMKG